MAVIELTAAFPGAAPLPVRTEPLLPEERVVSLAYPNGGLRFAGGRFAQYGTGDRFAGAALLELHDGNDRLVLDHGASGAPVLDCEGRVVAVVSTLITQTIRLPTGAVRVSTAWQTPNVVSIPAEGLKGLSSVRVRQRARAGRRSIRRRRRPSGRESLPSFRGFTRSARSFVAGYAFPAAGALPVGVF